MAAASRHRPVLPPPTTATPLRPPTQPAVHAVRLRQALASCHLDADVVEVPLSTDTSAATPLSPRDKSSDGGLASRHVAQQPVKKAEVEDDDTDSDEDDDEESGEDSEEEEEEEEEEPPTPTNELVAASDEFEWIRSSPILTQLLEEEQKQQSRRNQFPPRSTDTVNVKRRPPIDATASGMVPGARDRLSLPACPTTARPPAGRRREDYPVVGGEKELPGGGGAAATVAAADPQSGRVPIAGRPSRPSSFAGGDRCPCNDCLPSSAGTGSSLTPAAAACHRSGGGSCSCGCENVGWRTLPATSVHRSRTPQPYMSDPTPPMAAAGSQPARVRPRAHSQPRTSHRRRRHRAELDSAPSLPPPLPTPVHPFSAFGCPFNHGRNLALEYVQWMSFFKANGLPLDYDDLQEKVHRLEEDKESLSMQVSVLGEQIEAQTDKIRDLEASLENKKGQLENVEDMLQHGLMTLESQKLDLMAEISNLKVRLTSIEKEKLEMEDRARKAELESIGLKTQLSEKDRELLNAARSRPPTRHLLTDSASDTARTGYHVSPDNSLRRVQQRYLEMEKLRKALECVMAANDEKDRKIDELQNAVTRYKTVQERVLSPHFRKSNSYTTEDEDCADGSPNKGHEDNTPKQRTGATRMNDKPPVGPRPYATSTPLHMRNDCPPEMSASSNATPSIKHSPASTRAISSEEITAIPQKTPPVQLRYGVDHYGTIPRKHSAGLSGLTPPDAYRSVHNVDLDPSRLRSGRPSGLSFGKGFFRLKTGKRSCSAPNLGPGENPHAVTDHPCLAGQNNQLVEAPPSALDQKQKPKGIKKIFGRLKRSNSQHLDEPVGEFRRGGVRSTAGPRLGWSSNEIKAAKERVDAPFALWNGEKIATWLHDMGLTAYIGDCKRWVKNGSQLLNATTHDLEKELGIRNPLHRKKVQLALQAINADGDSIIGTLDYNWVTRWLDDVGLPQYKDAFCDARIDGRVLNSLTVEDLFLLKVTNMLHYISLKRGIQVLRMNNFNPNCLKRRPSPEEVGKPASNADIALWTNHRVMEWLRSVDLSEYAPNLRGSGVHGAILVFEAKFNVELLASLLSIPANKTLLRRHLSTHFKQLVGAEVVKQKRDYEAEGLLPLNPGMRIKANRRSQFTLMKKKNKHDIDLEDYVCPLDASFDGGSSNIIKDSEDLRQC